MRIGIIGSRRRTAYWDFHLVTKSLEEILMLRDIYWRDPTLHTQLCSDKKCLHIISGGCSQGADKFAEIIAEKWKIPKTIHEPKYEINGRAAPFIRNDLVAQDSDILIACVAQDRTGGTEDTIKKFKKYKPAGELKII